MRETKQIEKHVRYGSLLLQKIIEIISEEGSELDINRIAEYDDLTDFMHALANVMPTVVYNRITGSNVDLLGFNHFANRLCFQYGKKSDAKSEEK